MVAEDWNVTTWQIDDALLWMTALSHSKMFAQVKCFLQFFSFIERHQMIWYLFLNQIYNFDFYQIPFLHESLMMEREDRLSEEEKLEARMLYEREKQIYKNGDFDYDWTPRSVVGRGNEFDDPRMQFPRMWPSTP